MYKFHYHFDLGFNGTHLRRFKVTILAENEAEALSKFSLAVAQKIDLDIVKATAEIRLEATSKEDAQRKAKEAINKVMFNPKDN